MDLFFSFLIGMLIGFVLRGTRSSKTLDDIDKQIDDIYKSHDREIELLEKKYKRGKYENN